jgi:hypothetical protein
MRTSIRLFSAACAVCVALGCGDDPAGPGSGGTTSTLSLTYTGDVSGSYVATGLPTLPAPEYLAPADYAAAVSYPAGSSRAGTLSIIANDAAGAEGGNMLLLQGIPTRRTTVSLSPSVGGLLHMGLTWTSSFFGSQVMYVLDAGELTVTDYSATRARGTFRGTAYWHIPGSSDRTRTITIANGRFDLVVDDPNAGAFRCSLFAC